MPLFVMSIVFFFGTLFSDELWGAVTFILPFLKVGDIKVEENLPNYYNSLDREDRDLIIKEEDNCRDVLKFNTLSDKTLDKLRETKPADKNLQGTPNYDILTNVLYVDDFQYFSPALEDRDKCIIDDDEDEGNDTAQSDLVRLVLALAYMKEQDAVKFKFEKSAFAQ